MNSGGEINSYKKKSNAERAYAEFAAAEALADVARAKAHKARADAAKAQAKADRAGDELNRALEEAIRRGEALMNLLRQEEAHASAQDPASNDQDSSIHNGSRELLIKALGMLGSDQVGERAAAALMVEKQRVKLRKTWHELIINEQHEDLDDDDDLYDEHLDDDDLDDEDCVA